MSSSSSSIEYSLVIVESPAKCKKMEEYLGPGYKCVASFGHIRELPHINNIDVDNGFSPTFEAMKSKAANVSQIKKMANATNCKEVVIATDDDREGEAIGWHICQVLKLPVKTTKRIIFHEISRRAVSEAIANPTLLNMSLVEAQKCRQILDVLVGFTISPMLWNAFNSEKNSKKSGLSAGRCQTPALRLVYDNHVSMQESPGKIEYKITALFTDKIDKSCILPFVLQSDFSGENVEEQVESFLKFSMGFEHTMSVSGPVLAIRSSPIPFTTAGLLQIASNEMRLGAKETMKYAQTLYENGLITYMRTECEKYSIEFLDSVQSYISNDPTMTLLKNNMNANLTTQLSATSEASAAHEAIRPVSISLTTAPERLGVNPAKLYELIRRHTLESCMSAAQIHIMRAEISAPLNKRYTFACEQVKILGWKCVSLSIKRKKEDVKKDENDVIYRYLQLCQHKENNTNTPISVEYLSITGSPHLVETKLHLTEARLIQKLKDQGIGRPSTFASIVDKIQEKGYVKKQDIVGQKRNMTEYRLNNATDRHISPINKDYVFGKEKDKLIIQPLGISIVRYCVENWPTLFDFEFTNQMEKELDVIALTNGDEHTNQLSINICTNCCETMKNKKGENAQVQAQTPHISIEIMDDDDDESYKSKKGKNKKRLLTLIVGKKGPVIMDKTNPKKISFLSVCPDLDLAQLAKRQESIYLKEVLLKKEDKMKDKQYGANANDDGTQNEVREKTGILREINTDVSIRQGKFGNSDYIFYKTSKMKKPHFISLAKCPHNYMLCDSKIILELIS